MTRRGYSRPAGKRDVASLPRSAHLSRVHRDQLFGLLCGLLVADVVIGMPRASRWRFRRSGARINAGRSGARLRTTLMAALLAALLPALPATAGATLAGGEKLGTIQFDVTGDATTREHVVRGVKLLHHMMYPEADREFAAVLAHDPDCGFGYWGRAMALIHPLWPDIPDTHDLQLGLGCVQAGAACSLHSPRERAYLATMEAFFKLGPDHSLPERLQAADTAWAATVAQYPGDLDAAAFGALYHLAPARFLPKDKSYRRQIEAAAVLDGILAQIPDHPGALHYKIHALDFPLLAGRALEVCDAYGEVAPDVPHALHMPTHILPAWANGTNRSTSTNARPPPPAPSPGAMARSTAISPMRSTISRTPTCNAASTKRSGPL